MDHIGPCLVVVVIKNFVTNVTCAISTGVVPIPGSGDPSDSYSCPGHLTIVLLKCILRRAALENYPEATTGSESRGADRVGSNVLYSYDPTALRVALITN